MKYIKPTIALSISLLALWLSALFYDPGKWYGKYLLVYFSSIGPLMVFLALCWLFTVSNQKSEFARKHK